MSTTTEQRAKSMEQRFAEIGKRIDAISQKVMHPAVGPAEVRDSISRERDVWRRWVDESRLQANLARMEAREALEPAIEKVDLAFGDAVERIDEALAATEFDAAELQAYVAKEIKGLRAELEAAGRHFKIAE